ncbi:MAG TPA: response regulator, partial [Ktedonobacterales bacterium]
MGQAGSGALTGAPRVARVLVVDDEENLNWSLVTSLRREQYAADGALTAEDARRRMVDETYDCIISDIQMPGMDGFQLLSWLREQRPQSRVIMMTAFGSPSVRQEAIRNGVAAYLEKPFDLTALKRELRKALDTPAQPSTTYDLIEITQVISLSRRDVAVQAQVGEQLGMLVFERGELISAT